MKSRQTNILSLAAKCVLLLTLAASLNGCVITSMISSGIVNENLEPQSVIVTQDGKLAIKAKGSYCRLGFLALLVEEHFGWMMESNEDYKEIPVWSHKPNIRYLAIEPSFIESSIHDSKAINGVYTIDHVSIPGTDYVDFLGDTLFGKVEKQCDATVFPQSLRAQSPELDQIPGLRSGRELPLNEPVLFLHEGNARLISFDQLKIGSSRMSYTWWEYPIICTFYYAPLTILAIPYWLTTRLL